MSEKPKALSLDARLDNWASAGRGRHDAADAVLVEQAWQRLAPSQKEMLRMTYLWRAGREVVCRRLGIPRYPWCGYELELASAKRALASLLTTTS
ncbi:hypothetical protein BLA23254_02934 [Burkholderia lata]|uniref:Uncharacterized protein n=1 Tax=Burkholderia lata (strain ATCC 17760 / DSM 23089 / LMG 22485 / NCIMB 9086 / R18194 / 383) TaxID=482957 RepID=A0A6P2L8K7_BURL3|nr:hypothetical protein [Burkholderia lata]VWB63256.1 hypothetical protein BLA23254_02934 [Burkholderia lata]